MQSEWYLCSWWWVTTPGQGLHLCVRARMREWVSRMCVWCHCGYGCGCRLVHLIKAWKWEDLFACLGCIPLSELNLGSKHVRFAIVLQPIWRHCLFLFCSPATCTPRRFPKLSLESRDFVFKSLVQVAHNSNGNPLGMKRSWEKCDNCR